MGVSVMLRSPTGPARAVQQHVADAQALTRTPRGGAARPARQREHVCQQPPGLHRLAQIVVGPTVQEFGNSWSAARRASVRWRHSTSLWSRQVCSTPAQTVPERVAGSHHLPDARQIQVLDREIAELEAATAAAFRRAWPRAQPLSRSAAPSPWPHWWRGRATHYATRPPRGSWPMSAGARPIPRAALLSAARVDR